MPEIKCTFCDNVANSDTPHNGLDNYRSAWKIGWIPFYHDRKTNETIQSPVCPMCIRHKLSVNGVSDIFELPDDDKPIDEDDAENRITDLAHALSDICDRAADADLIQSDAAVEWKRLRAISDNLQKDRKTAIVKLQCASVYLSEYTG